MKGFTLILSLFILLLVILTAASILTQAQEIVVPNDTKGDVQSLEFKDATWVTIKSELKLVGNVLCKFTTINSTTGGSVIVLLTFKDGQKQSHRIKLKAQESAQVVKCGDEVHLPSGTTIIRPFAVKLEFAIALGTTILAFLWFWLR